MSSQRRSQQMFGPYLLFRTIGEGEFGKVKLAKHKLNMSKEVAIKLIKKDNLNSPIKRDKLMREISILQVIETDQYIGMIMEFASGGELFEHILAHKYLKEQEAQRFFSQLIASIHYLHSHKYVHRDLKLENLLLDGNRNIIVTDFGFANSSTGGNDKLLNTSCGSPCYAAPELVISDGYVGEAADIWSCGVILFAMLCGYLPYDDDPTNPDGDNINLLYKYILETELIVPDYVSVSAKHLLKRILVPDPKHRAQMKEIFEHPWLQPYTEILDESEQSIIAMKVKNGEFPSQQVPVENITPIEQQPLIVPETTNRKVVKEKISKNFPQTTNFKVTEEEISEHSTTTIINSSPQKAEQSNDIDVSMKEVDVLVDRMILDLDEKIEGGEKIEEPLVLDLEEKSKEVKKIEDPMVLDLEENTKGVEKIEGPSSFKDFEMSEEAIVPRDVVDQQHVIAATSTVVDQQDSIAVTSIEPVNEILNNQSSSNISQIAKTNQIEKCHVVESQQQIVMEKTEDVIISVVESSMPIQIVKDSSIPDTQPIANEVTTTTITSTSNEAKQFEDTTMEDATDDTISTPSAIVEKSTPIASEDLLEVAREKKTKLSQKSSMSIDVDFDNGPSLFTEIMNGVKGFENRHLASDDLEELSSATIKQSDFVRIVKPRVVDESKYRKSMDVSRPYVHAKKGEGRKSFFSKSVSEDLIEEDTIPLATISNRPSSTHTGRQTPKRHSQLPNDNENEPRPSTTSFRTINRSYKLRYHSGPIDQRALTNRSPRELIDDIMDLVERLGMHVRLSSSDNTSFKLKIVRPKTALFSSSIHEELVDKRISTASVGSTTLEQSSLALKKSGSEIRPQVGLKRGQRGSTSQFSAQSSFVTNNKIIASFPVSLFRKIKHLARLGTAYNKGFDGKPTDPQTKSSGSGSVKSGETNSNHVVAGEPLSESGEIKFYIEIQKIKNLKGLFVVEFKRRQGDIWEFKRLYQELVPRLPLGEVIG